MQLLISIHLINFVVVFFWNRRFYKNMNQKSWKNNHFVWITLLFFVALLVLLPLFMNFYHAGHDTKYHIANILAIESQIEAGHIPTSPILDKIGYGLGYGTRLFYPPLSHTITAYLFALCSEIHFTVTDALKFVHFLALFLSGCTMYFLSYHLSKNRKIAFISAVIYITFPYHISDIYVRDSLAECFLYSFLPMILLAVYELLEGNVKKFYPLFVIGYVGGILAHFTLMIYFTLLLAIFLLFSRKKVLGKKFLLPFLIASISVLGIVSFFLLPLFENRYLIDYVVFEPGEMTKRIVKTALYPFEYLNIFPFLQSNIKFYFPVILLLLILITFIKRKQISFPKYTKNFLVFGIVAFFLSTKLFPWKFVPDTFQMIQFPWRFEIFVGLIVSLFAPLCLKNKNSKSLFILLLLIFLISSYRAIASPSEEIMNLEDIWWNGGMGWQKEYLPIVAKQNKDYLKKKKQNITFLMGEGEYQILENKVPNLAVQINVEDASIVEFPRIYYPGYQLTSNNGEKIPTEMSEYGLLQAEILNDGVYTLKYTGTFLNKVTKRLSVCVFTLNLFGYCIYSYKRKNTKKIKS